METVAFNDVAKLVEGLGYRDKLRLAQLLIQLARKEEEEQHPDNRANAAKAAPDPELILYVAERLKKLKPSKKETALNSIGAMFQFQGGITDGDKEKIFAELLRGKHISIENNKIRYSAV